MTSIVVLAKEPIAGRVKTRLCPPCTPGEAAHLAAAALQDTLAAVTGAQCTQRVLAFDGRATHWAPKGWSTTTQPDGDLGRRLDAAVREVEGPVLVVGMDTPQLTPRLLELACARLHTGGTDAVLGPAADGGFWAIGFRDRRAGAFDDVVMSSPDTGRQQRTRLGHLGLRVAALPPLRDVDTYDDARSVAALIPDSTFARAFRRTAAA